MKKGLIRILSFLTVPAVIAGIAASLLVRASDGADRSPRRVSAAVPVTAAALLRPMPDRLPEAAASRPVIEVPESADTSDDREAAVPGPGDEEEEEAAAPEPLKPEAVIPAPETPAADVPPVPDEAPIPDDAETSGGTEDRYAALSLSEEDLELLARLIWLEARGEPFDGQTAVAEVVLNRVLSPDFPDTVAEVIYQPGQFTPAARIPGTVPGEEQYLAAAAAADGAVCVLDAGALFFSGAPYNSRVCAVIGSHYFCLM